jgi:hypothetical protein
MQKKLAYLVRHYWPILFLVIAEAILFATNYKPGTFLIGWDNLYPELNSGLNIKRSFFAIWQEYRSLGYMDGMSHAANLFHDIFRWLLSLIMPLNLVRWTMIFLLHLTGGIGMYWLMQHYVFKKSHTVGTEIHSSHHPLYNTFTFQLLGLFAGLFYQYNLITIQQFFLPFELFLFHFAFLPWLVYLCLEYNTWSDLP